MSDSCGGTKMRCQNCGKPLKWLYYAKESHPAALEHDSNFFDTDYAICSECTMIYKRNIISTVKWMPMVFGPPLTIKGDKNE